MSNPNFSFKGTLETANQIRASLTRDRDELLRQSKEPDIRPGMKLNLQKEAGRISDILLRDF